ncbi:MAG TPA: hypothetical protein PKA41_11020 [Verrucomicrobiota bacterium]|nr:hypothetical protein [Verrucomicrobiota bacterium]
MQRPQIVTIFGILNIAFGILGILGALGMLAMFLFLENTEHPMLKAMRESIDYANTSQMNVPLALLSSGLVIMAGIGLLKFKEWGRRLSILYSAVAIVIGVSHIAANHLWHVVPTFDVTTHQKGSVRMGGVSGKISGDMGILFGLIYPVFLLVIMTRPKLVSAFHPAKPPPLPQRLSGSGNGTVKPQV